MKTAACGTGRELRRIRPIGELLEKALSAAFAIAVVGVIVDNVVRLGGG
jgi:hypothetical protein